MDFLLAHCAALFSFESHWMLVFFIAGLTGGFTHCLPMCGPYVACERMCSARGCGNGLAVLGLPHHLGRLTTYGMLGFAVALLARQLAATGWWHMLAMGMIGGAGLLFLYSCARPACSHGENRFVRPGTTYVRGVLLGFLPCGLLYAALMMAATLPHPLHGLLAMSLFALGTMPALLIAQGGAALLSRRWHKTFHTAGRALMAVNGITLLAIAAQGAR